MKRAHFVGIKGSGMSALAQIYAKSGWSVSGSDSAEVFFTDQLLEAAGIANVKTPAAENADGADVVIRSSAYGNEHPEVKRAAERGIPVKTYAQALGELTKSKRTVCVSGAHGKTTTTSMIANVFLEAGMDPAAVVGSKNYNLGSNARGGEGPLVLESCEYKRNFLNYSPSVAVVNNIDFDHPDYFSGIGDVFSAFQEFVSKLPKSGSLVACGDDPLCRRLDHEGPTLYFGFGKDNDLRAEGFKERRGFLEFEAHEGAKRLGEVKMRAIGKHNALNALGALAAARAMGVSFEDAKKAFENYKGVYRRFDYLGNFQGAEIYDDYAHHPSEVRTTLQAAKNSFSEEKLTVVFQPHTYSRTKQFLERFADALAVADEIVLAKIFASAREAGGEEDLDGALIREIEKRGKRVRFAQTLEACESAVRALAGENGIVVTMGAGNIRSVGEALFAK